MAKKVAQWESWNGWPNLKKSDFEKFKVLGATFKVLKGMHRYIAVDANGSVYGYYNEPLLNIEKGEWETDLFSTLKIIIGYLDFDQKDDWTKTLMRIGE